LRDQDGLRRALGIARSMSSKNPNDLKWTKEAQSKISSEVVKSSHSCIQNCSLTQMLSSDSIQVKRLTQRLKSGKFAESGEAESQKF
jgi:hypothetical protein